MGRWGWGETVQGRGVVQTYVNIHDGCHLFVGQLMMQGGVVWRF